MMCPLFPGWRGYCFFLIIAGWTFLYPLCLGHESVSPYLSPPGYPLEISPKICASAQEQELILIVILPRCAQYCDKLMAAVLDFVCLEKIHEYVVGPTEPPEILRRSKFAYRLRRRAFFDEAAKTTNDYLYDYQLVSNKRKVEERRILLRKNGKSRHREDAPLETRFAHKNLVYGPISLLSQHAQLEHDYRVICDGEDTIVLEAVPKDPENVEHLYGQIWISKTDFSIARIEWYENAVKGIDILEIITQDGKVKPGFRLATEFNFEKNGIRFPSRHQFTEMYVPIDGEASGDLFVKSEKVVEFTDYRFFIVETDVVIK